MPKLTKRIVDQSKPGTGQIFVWDTDVPGFGLRVLPSGQRSYVIQYRARGRSRRMTLGKHGALTPQTARKMAIWVCPDSVDTFTMPRGQAFPDLFLVQS